jgi:hypothetical protein
VATAFSVSKQPLEAGVVKVPIQTPGVSRSPETFFAPKYLFAHVMPAAGTHGGDIVTALANCPAENLCGTGDKQMCCTDNWYCEKCPGGFPACVPPDKIVTEYHKFMEGKKKKK